MKPVFFNKSLAWKSSYFIPSCVGIQVTTLIAALELYQYVFLTHALDRVLIIATRSERWQSCTGNVVIKKIHLYYTFPSPGVKYIYRTCIFYWGNCSKTYLFYPHIIKGALIWIPLLHHADFPMLLMHKYSLFYRILLKKTVNSLQMLCFKNTDLLWKEAVQMAASI